MALKDTEVFRFVCARPALQNDRVIRLRLTDGIPAHPSAVGVNNRGLRFASKVAEIETLLKLDPNPSRLGLVQELPVEVATAAIRTAFPNEDLDELVNGENWKRDENLLDASLMGIWDEATDPAGKGPQLTRFRQIYDLVRQAAAVEKDQTTRPNTPKRSGTVPRKATAKFSKSTTPKVLTLKGLQRYSPTVDLPDANSDDDDEDPDPTTGTSDADEANKKRMSELIEALNVLNSSVITQYRFLDKTREFQFLVKANWAAGQSGDVKKVLTDAGIDMNTSTESISHYYSLIMRAIRSTQPPLRTALKFQSGVFSIGPFSLEMKRPWSWPTGALTTRGSPRRVTPVEKKSNIKPTGVGDLLVVRDHVWSYIGGDIGAIQNVLKSEILLRETKRLDRTELVEFTSSELTTEEEKEDITTKRFALAKEANDVIKQDSSMKAGVSTTVYGPYVTVKGDLSVAQSSSTESSNKIASQFSQDVTSRAASKIIEKTFSSTSRTTISEFTERNKHEFRNNGTGATNISGVYQWVNKVSQCQMYNYGRRLLIDITIPEPAALLLTQSTGGNPTLKEPQPFTESATDLHEGNFSTIAARYQATGIKPPGEMLISVSKSFKAEIAPGEVPKPGMGHARFLGGQASANFDLEVPVGYLIYAAKIQVGVRTGQWLNWEVVEGRGQSNWMPSPQHTRKPNPHISVAGRLIRPDSATIEEIQPQIGTKLDDASATEAEKLLFQDSVATVFFTDVMLGDKIAVAIAQEFCLACSGTIQLYCIRAPNAYAQWQQSVYDAILTAYISKKMEYDRLRSETAISTMSVTTGNNPLENTSIISTEMKRAAIAFLTQQNFELFGSVVQGSDGIPDVEDFDKALKQARYADFFEKAFEWENITYALYPYFWAHRDTWNQRIGFHSPDPAFSAFVKAGMAKVTVPARLGFGLEVLHLLDSGRLWQDGPISTLMTEDYYSIGQEVLDAEQNPTEVKVSEPWYTVIPTDLVRLRKDDELPNFRPDKNGVWVEKTNAEIEREDEEPSEEEDEDGEDDDEDDE
ncbi:hypothetical protein FB567DRAFT_575688 [Paraphoma chrysanthemicola]|uniref:MACPF domain-containing protein n=1 Tax=Paraphoma chrysanthemicola TaxID=798071 RepID=A0A8K0RLL3_9PLEO|nr:hypothetical protein FB567DRAFT_575688 [Paraphoma chrysanthemicola]